jgi:hypothetical protein
MVPRFDERLMECTDDEVMGMADLVGVFNCMGLIRLDFSSYLL